MSDEPMDLSNNILKTIGYCFIWAAGAIFVSLWGLAGWTVIFVSQNPGLIAAYLMITFGLSGAMILAYEEKNLPPRPSYKQRKG